MKRLFSMLLCFLMLLALLGSCAPAGGDGEGTTVGGGDTTSAPTTEGTTTAPSEESTTAGGSEEVTTPEVTEPIVLPEPTVYKMTKRQIKTLNVVYPDGASNEILEVADSIQKKIRELYKVNATRSADSNTTAETAYEIVLTMDTNRGVNFNTVRGCAYGYQIVGTKILIAGLNGDADTVLAAQQFIENCLAEENDGLYFYTSEQDRFFNQDAETYHHESLMLNGFEIQNYRIVYPAKDDKFESEQAYAIRDAIAADTGWYLSVITDAEANRGELEILVGSTNRKNHFTLVGDSTTLGGVQTYRNFVYVGGNCAAANVLGANLLLDAIKAATQNQVDTAPTIELKDEAKSIFKEDHTVSAMTFNLWVGGYTTRREVAVEQIKRLLPDTVGVQEASTSWWRYLVEQLGDYYTVVGFGRESTDVNFETGSSDATAGEGTFVLIAKDKYDLVQTRTYWLSDTPTVPKSKYDNQQYLRVFTWAELTRKSDGKTFVHCNTHLDFSTEIQKKEVTQILNAMQPYVDAGAAVIITGDFNMNATAAAFQQFAPAGFTSSEVKATKIGVGGNTFPNKEPGPNYSSPTTRIDFLMTSENITVSYHTVLRDAVNGLNVSDHCPVYIEFNY